ncbi:MAG: formate dehydrogenase accessory sulfurtransferase FdhD [Planctomycetota bacterium]|nr:formate dehydrogenase accessory sulfurtransferase FdhD [Planctomycetota bacterium]
MNRSSASFEIERFRDGRREGARLDEVAAEEPLEIRVNHAAGGERRTESLSVTMRTPGHDFELCCGFLVSEGLLKRRKEVLDLSWCLEAGDGPQQHNVVNVTLSGASSFDPAKLRRHFYMTSSCGVCGKASLEALKLEASPLSDLHAPRLSASVIHALPEKLRAAQAVFAKTGGLHAAALFDARGELLLLREDVGRHNAVDKIVGERFQAGALPLAEHVLLVSGRASFEILQKALMAGIPVVAAVGAPSSLAVETARAFNQTLLGFVRAGGFNTYAGGERIA